MDAQKKTMSAEESITSSEKKMKQKPEGEVLPKGFG